ncbi:C3a anaphylatoxin chemotactic receptor [Amia ocellicauda]|uniref:C3a anaphylatoxin chemotactic receptor n=1 Tax=Amia ocellicauda TaxID=2972642 RepID=UPI00346419B8
MDSFSVGLFVFRCLISVVGIVGNSILVVSTLKHPTIKTFEVFILGLTVSNFEGILVVNISDIMINFGGQKLDELSCRILRFMTVLGETATILFTVLICVFRYQKLRDAEVLGHLHALLDNLRLAWALTGLCFLMAVFFSLPTYFIEMHEKVNNSNTTSSCSSDVFQCPRLNCAVNKVIYKSLYLLLNNLIPLITVTVTSALTVNILLRRRNVVISEFAGQSPAVHHQSHHFWKSTKAVLAAMCIFQVDWTMYLILHLALDSSQLASWSEIEFCILTIYSTISPYLYIIGNNIFSRKSTLH